MSLVKLAHEKNAVEFGKALVERLEQKVGQALAETKVEIAGTLLENPNGIVTDAEGGVKTKAEGGLVGKNRLPDTTGITSSEPGVTPGTPYVTTVSKKPLPGEKGRASVDNPHMPGKANEETEKPAPHEDRAGSKGKRAIRMAMKKKYDKKRADESVDSTVLPQVDEKVISPGSVDHMAHAVHQCATGQHPVHSHRGTFTNYEHPHYSIHKDHGGIHPDKAEHRYHVMGSGGHHVFTVHHGSKGVDVKHVGKQS